MTVTETTHETHGCRRTIDCEVLVPAFLSRDKKEYYDKKPIDFCLVDAVNALNGIGAYTASCCCGHGVVDDTIMLHDKTIITIPQCPIYLRDSALKMLAQTKKT